MRNIMKSGIVFGRLTSVVKLEGTRPLKWLFSCECGTEKQIRSVAVTGGQTKSCGCLSLERLEEGRKNRISHGMSNIPEYAIWTAMIRRCENPNSKGYSNYGGRGISVCPRWRHSFSVFIEDVGYRPIGMSLERNRNSGNYEPGNVSWASVTDQARNRRSSRLVEWKGRTVTLAEACELSGANYKKVHERLSRGRSLEESILACTVIDLHPSEPAKFDSGLEAVDEDDAA